MIFKVAIKKSLNEFIMAELLSRDRLMLLIMIVWRSCSTIYFQLKSTMEALEEEKMKVQRLLGKWEVYRDRRWKPKLCDLLLSEQNREPCLKKPHIIDDNVLREVSS